MRHLTSSISTLFFALALTSSCKKTSTPAIHHPVVPLPKDSTIVKTVTAITIVRGTQTFATLSAAVAAAQANDVIEVPAGTYTNDFVNLTLPLTIHGVGGMAHFVATVSPPNGKAIFLANSDISMDHIEMSGSSVSDMNGAGIKQETGSLTLNQCYFHDNQDGVLTNAATTGITITYCEFAHNGAGDGYSHNLYVGATAKAVIQHSYFHDAVVGHELKCRALNSLIENCRIQNGIGTASYCIDLPQGGASIIRNDTIEKGVNAQNPNIFHYGGEAVNAGSSLAVSNLLVVSQTNTFTFFLNQMADGTPGALTALSVYSIDDSHIISGPGTVTGTIHLAAAPVLNRRSEFHN